MADKGSRIVWYTLTSNDGKEYLKHTYIPTDPAYANDEQMRSISSKFACIMLTLRPD